MKTHKYNNVFPYIFAISFVLFVILSSFYVVCFIDKNMLIKLFDKYNTPINLPFELSREDLILIQDELMGYLSGKLQFLETKVHINNILTDFYSIRVKIHMGDVRNLFMLLVRACYILIALCLLSLIRSNHTLEKPIVKIKKAYIKVLIVFTIVFIFVVACAIINFDFFFTKFHEILFSNDYWLLDPRDDFIICLLPEVLFINIGIKIAIAIIISLLLVYLCLGLLSKIQPRQEAR